MTAYLVTGAAGFLGFHVVKLLNERGIRPRVLVPATMDSSASSLTKLRAQDVDLVEGDVDDPAALKAACDGVDRVLHLSFAITLGGGPRTEETLYQGNVVGTNNLLQAAAQSGVSRVVVSSSSLAVGINREPHPIDEEADWERHAFTLPYAVSRREAEQEALARLPSEPPEVVVVNPSFTLGPDDDIGAPANGLVKRMSKPGFRINAPIGFGLLDVRDYADGVLRAAERGTPGRRYLLSGTNLTPDQLAKEVALVAGIAPPSWSLMLRVWMVYPIIVVLNAWARLRGRSAPVSLSLLELWGRYAWYDTRRARDELGWEPRSLQASLEDTIRWLREQSPS